MRRTLALATVALAALSTAGIAVAHLTSDGTQAASATFTAARERAEIRTCAGRDGDYEIVNGRYEGRALSTQAVLDGPISINVNAVFNRTERIGWIKGSVRIRRSGDDDHSVQARLVGTLTQGPGDTRLVDGFVDGRVGGHFADLFGNVAASFTGTGGFTSGKIGEGAANTALLAGRPCTGKPGISVRLVVEGRIETLTSSSIAVRPDDGSALQACQIRSGVSPSTSRLRVGDRVEMECGLVDGSMTLLKVKKRNDDD